MIVRNTHGLPRALVETITSRAAPDERRHNADISVTELIGPPRIKQLRDKFYDEVDIDASDCLHSLMGTAIHGLIAKTPYSMSEVRLHCHWMGLERMWSVSGSMDLIEDGILWDFKPVRAGAVFDGPKEDWVQQLNIYRVMCEENGIRIHALRACPYVRDYTPVERYRNARYPIAPMVPMEVDMWSMSKAKAFIEYRLSAHEDEMPECTIDERWQQPHEYALMCSGYSRAIRLFSKRDDAEYQMRARKQANPAKKFWIVERHAEALRCKYYCDFWRFCDKGLSERAGMNQDYSEEPEL